jgi:hypothetical protein
MPADRDVFSARATANDGVMQPEARQAWRRIGFRIPASIEWARGEEKASDHAPT